MSASTLVRGRWVIPGAKDAVLSDGAVLVEGDTVAAVEDFDTLRRQHPQATVVGTDHSAVLPGFVNAHHHSHATTTIGHGVSDDLLEPWILSFAPMRQPDVYLNTLLSCVRQLRSGVTTAVDVHGSRGNAEQYAASVDAGLKAYEQAGMRVAFTTGRTMQCFLVHGKDQDQVFLDGLPVELRQRAASLLPLAGQGFSGEDYLDIVEERVRRYQDHPRIDVWFGPPGPQWVSDDLMQQIADRARTLDTAVQTHCVESFYEMLHGPRFYGQPTVLHLRDLGVLSERFSLAHGVWLKPAELEVLAETGAGVSHNPSSNLRLRAGIAPLNAMLEAGVTVGLGMDGTTLNEDEDMFTEMGWACVCSGRRSSAGRCPLRRCCSISPPRGARG